MIAKISFEQYIEQFFNNAELIRIKPYKAFVRKWHDLFEIIDWHLLDKNKMQEVFNDFGANKCCVFT